MLHGGDAKHVPFDKNVLVALPVLLHRSRTYPQARRPYGEPDGLLRLSRASGSLRKPGPMDISSAKSTTGSGRVVSLKLPAGFTGSVYPPCRQRHACHHQRRAGADHRGRNTEARSLEYLSLPHPGNAGSGHGVRHRISFRTVEHYRNVGRIGTSV